MVLLLNQTIYAKYILTKNFSLTSSSLPFFINSEVSTDSIILEDNEGELTLTIKNNDGTNYNDFEIQYEIYLEDSSLYTITAEDANNGKISGGALTENNITINFTPVEGATIKLNETVRLIVKSISPYSKQIIHEININKPDAELAFGSLSDFRKIEEADCEAYDTGKTSYAEIYSGNNEELEYDSDGALVFDEDNPILVLEVDEDEQLFQEEFSIYFTMKTDVMQGEGYGNTIASIGNGSGEYIGWISILQGYLHVYTYVDTNAGKDFLEETVQKGFGSYDITAYSNTVCNIQVTCNKTGMTRVFVNGNELPSFESGGVTMPTTHVSIGDLRPLRCLKYIGVLYDFSMYNVELTEEQVMNNWNYAKSKWID